MRRLVIALAIVLLVVVLLGSIAVAMVFRRSSFDAMIVSGAVAVQVESENWEHARISYALPVPAQGVSRQIDLQLQREGWQLSGDQTIVSSIYDPDPPPRHYFRTFGLNWVHESVFVRSFDSYGSNPGRVRIVVVRSFSWPRVLRNLTQPFAK